MSINHAGSINRENRKTKARTLTLLGFDLNELVSHLGVSSNTVKTYLRETKDVIYSDLEDLMYQDEIFDLFTNKEKKLLEYIKDSKERAEELSYESKKTHDISKGKGFMGWIHKNIMKDCDKYRKRNIEILREMKKLSKDIKPKIKEFKKRSVCPHLSKSILKFDVIISSYSPVLAKTL